MDTEPREDRGEPGRSDGSTADTRRWLRDLGALLALPALWVDHEPPEIASGLLSVLFGVLQLDGAYARFDDPETGRPLEIWRPSTAGVPPELRAELEAERPEETRLTSAEPAPAPAAAGAPVPLRVVRVPLALPWGTGLVLVSAARNDFPTDLETHLLRVATSQAAIAIHTARRLSREHLARAAAEDALAKQSALLRELLDEVGPSLAGVSRRVQEFSREAADLDAVPGPRTAGRASVTPAMSTVEGDATARDLLTLSRRELEVLGLLAQGLSNKEIAGVMWLSDRTVERHITGLYRKIGVARRSEATAYALRHGVA